MNLTQKIKLLIVVAAMVLVANQAMAWRGMAMPELRVEGRDLVDENGNTVLLHGFAQTYSPWFNEQGSKWSNYDVEECLKYNKGIIDGVLNAGWEVNFIRLHMDPYWSNNPGKPTEGEHDISQFNFARFKMYLDEVFIPMAQYAIDNGLYVIMRPPGVCPEEIEVGDEYQEYLIKVWTYVAQHDDLRNHPNIMFELANEPVRIKGTDGKYSGSGDAAFKNLKIYFQAVVDAMREQGCNNILWVPGLGYQSSYSGFAKFPIEGDNIGYAVHIYPGWFNSNSANGYKDFKAGWDKDIKPVADFAPIVITEMDWADEKYNSSWGKGVTGDEKQGFGANFMRLCDESGNASWLLFTGAELLSRFQDVPGTPGNYTFLNDPEACPWAVYHKFKEYRKSHYPRKGFSRKFTSDKGNDQYVNPVVYSDFPDIDAIRVGDTYYMMSTTMFYMPGATILKSYDLVNWEYAANPLDYLEATDEYSLINGKNRYGAGQWASAFQYHDGKFYLLINTNHDGAYLLTAEDVEGVWTKTKLNTGYYDCGLLFDDDGSVYVASGINEIRIAKVDENFQRIEEHLVVKRDGKGLEGSHLYHIGDYYYLYCTYGGIPGSQVCFRSKTIFGEYEEKMVLADNKSVHQGALFDDEDGNWYTLLFRDMWPYGRMPYLLEVEFKNDWPDVGTKAYEVGINPIVTSKHKCRIATNDVFTSYNLGKQWQWNHNPDNSRWSLARNAGWLTLQPATITDDIYQARNTLTQRMFGYIYDLGHSYATIRMDVSHVTEGLKAGLTVFETPQASVGVTMTNGKKRFFFETSSLGNKKGNRNMSLGDEITTDVVYLRAVTSFKDGTAEFYVGTDGENFKKIGSKFTMQYDLDIFVGNRWGLFCYGTKNLDGYVMIDWFTTEPDKFIEDDYFDPTIATYDEKSLTLTKLEATVEACFMQVGSTSAPDIIATFADGHQENVTMSCDFVSSNEEVVSVNNGRLTCLKEGTSNVRVTYQTPLGSTKSLTIKMTCLYFPLAQPFFNPSYYGSGSFNPETKEIVTGQWGFAGWHFNNGVNLKDYRYIVAKVTQDCPGLSFRLFDENNYWAGCASVKMQEKNGQKYFRAIIKGTEMDSHERNLDFSHLYIAGFWSNGGTPFIIEDVYVTNDIDFLNPTDALHLSINDDEPVDVYTLDGIQLLQGVTPAEAASQLNNGIYIMGGRKVLIQK